MITFKPKGRAGNFLFQASNCIAYAKKNGMDFTMPSTTPDPYWKPLYLQHLVNPKFDPSLETVVVKENGFPYQELPFEESWREKNIVLDGYFQSPKYFDAYREEVLKAFGFPWDNIPGWVSVHIRRGDAVRHSHKHFLATREWIEEQMVKFPGCKFEFFSDDLPWCKENFGHRKDCNIDSRSWAIKEAIGDARPEVTDLIAMSMGEHFILSASTYAWWGAWLSQNPSKRVIAPKLWMRPGWEGTDENTWRDICPPEWERA